MHLAVITTWSHPDGRWRFGPAWGPQCSEPGVLSMDYDHHASQLGIRQVISSAWFLRGEAKPDQRILFLILRTSEGHLLQRHYFFIHVEMMEATVLVSCRQVSLISWNHCRWTQDGPRSRNILKDDQEKLAPMINFKCHSNESEYLCWGDNYILLKCLWFWLHTDTMRYSLRFYRDKLI